MTRRGHFKKKIQDTKSCRLVANWPAADQALWKKLRCSGDALDDGGRAANWAPRTVANVETYYGHWLDWLTKEHSADLALHPVQRVTRERVRAFVADLQQDLAPFTVQIHLQRLGQMMAAMTETKEFGWIFRAANRLKPVSVRNKRQKMQPVDRLAALGFRLMDEAEQLTPGWQSPPETRYRNGLIIALLAYRPIRLGNLASIRIGRHLLQVGDGYKLTFAAEETKQGAELDFDVPTALTGAFSRYLNIHRPALIAHGPFRDTAGQALWLSRDGGAMTAAGIAQAIEKETKAAFGAKINPHLFRDCAATTIAIHDPGHAHVIAAILGHSSMVTSERHYNQAQTIDAGRQYHGALKSLRVNTRPVRLGKKANDGNYRAQHPMKRT